MNLRETWNECHKHFIKNREDIVIDEWLDNFSDIIENCKTPIIDLGCGSGNDTLYLINKGKKVISVDCSDYAIEKLKKNIPETTTVLHDMTTQFPFENDFVEVVIADLSLHYFSKEVTKRIISEISRVLTANGYLLIRVNSMNDTNFFAGQGKEIEKHFYLIDDITKGNIQNPMEKRFFDEEDIREFFKDWDIEYINEENMDRYGNGKILWKVCLKNLK